MILNHGAGLLLHSAVSLVIALVLLAVSIGGLALKPFARRGWVAYAVVHLLWLLVCIVVAMTFTIPQVLQNTPADPKVPRGAFEAGAYGGALCVLVVASVYPIFVLVNMNKPHVKAAFDGTYPDGGPGAPGGGYPGAYYPGMPPPMPPQPPPGPYGQ